MKLNIIGPINSLGYGITCVNIVKSLSKTCEIHLSPIGVRDGYQNDPAIYKALTTPMLAAPTLKIWHAHDLSINFGTRRIGFPIFELDRFTSQEQEEFNKVDDVFVCSEWAKTIIPRAKVVPLGVDRDIFFESGLPDKTIFMNVGKWEVRKGHDVLIDIFEKANVDAELWMCCNNPFNTPAEDNYWQGKYGKPNVRLFPRMKSQGMLANLIRQSSCGIFPARAEGWNLDLLEFMSCGKEVITTNFSAHTEFCSKENARLVDITEIEPAVDNKWFNGQGNWAKLGKDQIDQFVHHIREFNNNPTIGRGIETAKRFSWDNTANEIIRILSSS